MGIPAGAPQADPLGIVHHGAGGDEPQVHRGTVGGDGLEGGSGRAGGAAVVEAVHRNRHGPVQGEVAGFIAHASAKRHDSSVIGVHDPDHFKTLADHFHPGGRETVEVKLFDDFW